MRPREINADDLFQPLQLSEAGVTHARITHALVLQKADVGDRSHP
jgi:hypothetical protein